jgi:pimeloyl-ACP methyl ester carboxylesterase
MELNAASVGINPDDIVLAWTVHTQNITRTLKTLRAFAQPAATNIVPTFMNTSHVNPGLPGIADIHMGIITLPYYSDVPSAENPAAQLSSFWQAEPGAYAPPFDQIPLDPTSTHVTVANPIPVKNNDQTVPIIVTVPNAFSGMSKPANGWPVVIYGHGITRNRLDVFAVADTLAAIGYAAVAIDFPLHGVSPDDQPSQAPFWIENTPFAPIANERTFDSDFLNNETFTFGPDGLIDPSGIIFMPASLGSMLTSRDTLRQGIADLSVLAVSISGMDIDLDAQPDLDASNMAYVGHSWGAMHGTAFAAIEPLITRAFLSTPGGGIARFANASDTFGPVIESVLGSIGVEPGTADYEKVLLIWQTLIDSADPINWSTEAAVNTPVMLHEVIGDAVIPNYVLTAPLSGTEPMILTMGLNSYSTTQQSAEGLRAAGRFMPPAHHGSLLTPAGSAAAFFEMQKQMATFIASHGGAIVVTDESTMAPVVQIEVSPVVDLAEKSVPKTGKGKERREPAPWLEAINRRDSRSQFEQLDGFE